jgi:hypothetical protein
MQKQNHVSPMAPLGQRLPRLHANQNNQRNDHRSTGQAIQKEPDTEQQKMNVYRNSKHTITLIRVIAEESGKMPEAWRILEINDGDYELQFTYENIAENLWLPIRLRDGNSKEYKSMKAVFADITKISNLALIYYIGKGT